mmetsp:Transcript_62601/g.75340  ORF Transcript_62601/g.75340 Transcript_62601/m.75340 type:complete len:115 (-) Transcript_62601:503-847(-)
MQRAKNSWCRLVVRDHVRTVYFDDEYFDEVYHDARCCSNLRTACCGGNGEQIQIDSRLYCNLCVRTYPCCCIPACFPKCCFPWMNREELTVAHAPEAATIIREARDDAMHRLQI